MSRYSKGIPNDKAGNPLTENQVPYKALVSIVSENATASSVITLNDNTTDLEIVAVGSPVFISWVSRSDTNASVVSSVGGQANFDNVIPAGTVRKFVVPIERQVAASIVGANIANGLYNRIAYKSGGIGSVLTTQY